MTDAARALQQPADLSGLRLDIAAACASYRVVRERWGTARPRSVTAEKALARMKALACPG